VGQKVREYKGEVRLPGSDREMLGLGIARGESDIIGGVTNGDLEQLPNLLKSLQRWRKRYKLRYN